MDNDLLQLTLQLRNRKQGEEKYAQFHGDSLIGNKIVPAVGLRGDLKAILSPKNWSALGGLLGGYVENGSLDPASAAKIAGSLSNYSKLRQNFIDQQVKAKYDRMLHPPLTYLGDAFQYRTPDGKFNSVVNPHLGQAGAPYARTVPSRTAPLGALPDPGDVFDKLMSRQEGGRDSDSGLSSMLIYHATIIIHDCFRTNDNDKNISDSSSYLDLSPLYGYTMEMQRKVRDDKYKLGLLKPDTFAEDRLLRQPPGVCIMLVMYNRYHNYAAKQLYRINENGRFCVPGKYQDAKLVSVAKNFHPASAARPYGLKTFDQEFNQLCKDYSYALKEHEANSTHHDSHIDGHFHQYERQLESLLEKWNVEEKARKAFEAGHDAAWNKLDDDLFNTARLITCGMYIQVSVHDYLRALMGFHQYDTTFTLDPRTDFDQRKTTRGLGNQVTTEFNLLYRFHCAISQKDERYTEEFIREELGIERPAEASLQQFMAAMAQSSKAKAELDKQGKTPKPWEVTFGIAGSEDPAQHFKRNEVTGLFDDQQMISALTESMDDPISNFGPRNIPKCLKAVEIMGITQARRWEVGTLNDFREFFGMSRHVTFGSITKNVEVQNSLRDLYEHPDKVELYPGIFCESDEYMNLDPGPKETGSALWTAIFSDAITLVRSDRFYTVDWNTNSLTSWGMNEVTPNNEICKSSVFHRLIQRAFPGWFQYDSVRFFHPFYTADTNEKFAKAQGYGGELKRKPEPSKPKKPVRLEDFEEIVTVIRNPDVFVHPALSHTGLPKQIREVLEPSRKKTALTIDLDRQRLESEPIMQKYLEDIMRSITRRESVAMTNATFQLDATRDFAIPVVTRYVADFLGFGHLLRTELNLSGRYSENEIYEHITNCQIFLSYNADETKMLKRQNAFKSSIAVLTDLAEQGNIASANQWDITRSLFGRSIQDPMTQLGFDVAQQVLQKETKDTSKAAAILVLVCLDMAYNSVVSFTAVLDDLMKGLYDAARYSQAKKPTNGSTTNGHSNPHQDPEWLTVQKLAFSSDHRDQVTLERLIKQKARATVRLPILRVAKADYEPEDSTTWSVKKDQVVILDIHAAAQQAEAIKQSLESEFLTSQQNLAGRYAAYSPVRFSTLALTSMVRFMAQMKNLRRGHDAQGKLKRLHLDWTAEGYSNFMAAGRVAWIEQQVKHLPKGDKNKSIYTDRVLRPETDTYLTPSWDEMVPFPMTWKVRFDGFGRSDYTWNEQKYGCINTAWVPDDAPPWYQPQGISHFGGSFADTACVCAATGSRDGDEAFRKLVPKAAEKEPTVSCGCGLPTKAW